MTDAGRVFNERCQLMLMEARAAEQAVAREVMEESNIAITNLRYVTSQPWPFPGALMLGFSAVAEPDPPQVDGELEDARWFTFEEIDAALVRDGNDDGAGLLLSPSISIARALIEHWHAGMRTRGVDAPTHAETGH